MKKIMAGLLTLGALTLSLQAYDQAERIQDMQTMEVSMVEIQRGILYNNKTMVLKGVESLKKISRKVEISKKCGKIALDKQVIESYYSSFFKISTFTGLISLNFFASSPDPTISP